MKKQFFIIYDFVNDSRRAKFVKILEKYGIRIQYSVFEFYLTKARKLEMYSKLEKQKFFNNLKTESIIIIPVSKDSSKSIQRYGSTVDILTKAGIILV